MHAGTVRELWRYPVKSLAGERLSALRLDHRGVEGDRIWALVDREGGVASGKTTRRFRKLPGLLHHSSHLDGDAPVVTLADGRTARGDTGQMAELLEAIARPGWALRRENGTCHLDEGPVHLVTTSTLETLGRASRAPVSVERLRPNVLLETGEAGFAEDEWIGRRMRIGDVELHVVSRTVRCVMVNHAQRSLPARPDFLKTIGATNGACAGIYADVVIPGTIRTGHIATLLPEGGGEMAGDIGATGP